MRTLIAVLLGSLSPFAFAADTYPARPIRIIITVVPGGGADVTARTVGQKLTEAWGQQAIVDNRPGGNGIVGMSIAANANPDGYTIVLGTIGPVAVNPSLYSEAAVRPGEGLRAGGARGVGAERAGRASVGAGEVGEGADRVRQSQSRASSPTAPRAWVSPTISRASSSARSRA